MRHRLPLPRELWLATVWALVTWTIVVAITAAIVAGMASGTIR